VDNFVNKVCAQQNKNLPRKPRAATANPLIWQHPSKNQSVTLINCGVRSNMGASA
jgi:hypothetical protein